IILRKAKIISNGRLYKSGEIVPDTEITRWLAGKVYAEIINDSRPAKKRTEKTEIPRENDKNNT
ncbi:MAG: hypothetical protein IJG34_09610, partial [Synergistaceae bacterium]|nr:hypothetical protein [Synergistaceae bacterium]